MKPKPILTNDFHEKNQSIGNAIFKARSIYLAAYFITAFNKKMVGAELENGKVQFLFASDGGESDAMKEFSGEDGFYGTVKIHEFMKCVNKLKDIIKSMTKDNLFL